MLIIFDCDGVLVDSEIIASKMLSEHLSSMQVNMSPALCRNTFTGQSIKSVIEWVAVHKAVDLPKNFEITLKIRDRTAFKEQLQPIKDIHTVLKELQTKKCVASSGSLEKINHSLEICELQTYFTDNIFSASQVLNGKPAPDLFIHAAKVMNTEPADCIVIEDSVAGVTAAKKAGMVCLGFYGGTHAKTDTYRNKLLSAGADQVFDRMVDLPGMINLVN